LCAGSPATTLAVTIAAVGARGDASCGGGRLVEVQRGRRGAGRSSGLRVSVEHDADRVMDSAGAEELSPAQCWARLQSATWGRVATSIQTIAMVVPVPMTVLKDRIVFATDRGSSFDRAVQEQAISVQAEGAEPGEGCAMMFWSIVVSGICVPELDSEALLAQISAAGSAERPRLNCVPFSLMQGWRAPLPSQSAPPGAGARTTSEGASQAP
jgi:hypothetical protein